MSDMLFDMPAIEPAHRAVVDWQGNDLSERAEHPNPCVRQFGFGPKGTICKTCKHLIRHGYHNHAYFKCDLRKLTHGPGTDMKANWTACAKYEEETKGEIK